MAALSICVLSVNLALAVAGAANTPAANQIHQRYQQQHQEVKYAAPPTFQNSLMTDDDRLTYDSMTDKQADGIVGHFKHLLASGIPPLHAVQPMQTYLNTTFPGFEFDVLVGDFSYDDNLFGYATWLQTPEVKDMSLLFQSAQFKTTLAVTALGWPKQSSEPVKDNGSTSFGARDVPYGVHNVTNVGFTADDVNLFVNVSRACFRKFPGDAYCGIYATTDWITDNYIGGQLLQFNMQNVGTTSKHSNFVVGYVPNVARFVSFYDSKTRFLFAMSFHFLLAHQNLKERSLTGQYDCQCNFYRHRRSRSFPAAE